MFQWKIRMEKRVDSARALSSLPTARWQSVREVSLPLSIPPSSFVCHASATFPAAYFFPIGCAERATAEEGGGEECAANTGLTEERRTIESTGGQPRWLGRIRVPTCWHRGRGGESRVAGGRGVTVVVVTQEREREKEGECVRAGARVLVHYLPRWKALKAGGWKAKKEPHPAITKSSFLPGRWYWRCFLSPFRTLFSTSFLHNGSRKEGNLRS